MNVSIYVPNEGGVLRTSIERSGRPGAALLLCGALLIVPLIAIQTGSSSAASGPGHGHAHQASAPPSHGGYFPAWQLAADSIKTSGPAGTAAGGVNATATPPTTVATPPPTTTPTTVPAHIYSTPTTQPQRAWISPTTVPAPTTTQAPQAAPAAAPAQAPAANSRTGVVTYYDATPGTCASPTLPFGTVVTITNPDNGKTVSCTVDDREADTSRQIDLATETFAQIAPLSQGVIPNAELSW